MQGDPKLKAYTLSDETKLIISATYLNLNNFCKNLAIF